MGKSCKAMVVVGLTVLFLVLATSGTVRAEGVWMEGTVTKAPWMENYRHIEINNLNFLMNDLTTIYERVKNSDGSYSQPRLDLSSIAAGQKVLIRHQGFRIIEIIVLR